MPLPFAIWLVRILGIYVLLGLAFAVPFVWRGARCVDPAAAGGTWGFRLLVLPGVVALWPLLLKRWWANAGAPPTEDNSHRRRAGGGA